MGLLQIVVAALVLLALVLVALGARAFRRRRRLGGAASVTGAVLLLLLGGLLGAAGVGMQGYHGLTREETAARVEVRRLGEQRFEALFTFPDGRQRVLELAGDELYVDARILKWHPLANALGLHTGYQLDRVSGRYVSLEDERNGPRTVHPLSDDTPFDPFGTARRFGWLEPLVDARYGSGTFVPVRDGGRYLVQVSTSGLLIRPEAP